MRENLPFFGNPESTAMATINNRVSKAAVNAPGASAMDVENIGITDSQQSQQPQSLTVHQTATEAATLVQGEE